ncbi:hypothetical protein [Moraxella lacunata]|uniref:hypothetical protein n=1 Tax=Moraxella lacunata TaxID=477 RepID=UPI003EDEA936
MASSLGLMPKRANCPASKRNPSGRVVVKLNSVGDQTVLESTVMGVACWSDMVFLFLNLSMLL